MKVVYRPFPTSNHNYKASCLVSTLLYIVRFLHQTTTLFFCLCIYYSCISSVSYIKPQLCFNIILVAFSCISSVSYIKPQPIYFCNRLLAGCISSVSYIKPQPYRRLYSEFDVVYRPFPTSNHNCF